MKVVVVGAGPSALHFAATALERGQHVTMIDVGTPATAIPGPDATLDRLRHELDDPVGYFLGDDFQGIEVARDGEAGAAYYRLPPSKDYVFRAPARFSMQARGIEPLSSFTGGGLAQCWTAGAYPFTDRDLADFPFGHAELLPHYGRVAERIGVGGRVDDLAGELPGHDHLIEPIALNRGSAQLIGRYEARRAALIAAHGVRLGRSRQAALSRPRQDRGACFGCGRCLWGCPNGALYTPSLTLAELRRNPRLTYRAGLYASHFLFGPGDEIRALRVEPVGGAPGEEVAGDVFVLAAGAIGSSALYLRSYWARHRAAPALEGLMDNRQVLVPFLNLGMLGQAGAPEAYQYHQLALGLDAGDPAHYVHGQITMFTNGSAHPLIQQLPLGMVGGRKVFRALRSGLGVVNLNFHDTRRPENRIFLDPDGRDANGGPTLSLAYVPPAGEERRIRAALGRIGPFFRALGAPVVPGMTRTRPMGASVHYAGTLPMSAARRPQAVSPEGQSWDHTNLFVADGAALPFLPAKNLTFTLMALATRVAARLF